MLTVLITIPNVSITQYCLKGKTTSGCYTHIGVIALSRDIVKKHNLKFGDVVVVHDVGTFVFKDLMPPKWKMRVDVYVPSRKDALKFGIKKKELIIAKRNL